MFRSFLVLGGGSAGLLAALTLKKKIPAATVKVVRSPEIGIIGVGEGTAPNLPQHLFEYLGLSSRKFYERANPTWKLGIHFLWGPRKYFDYPIANQLDQRLPQLSRPHGFFCRDDMTAMCLETALMDEGKAFCRQPNGAPDMTISYGLHLENIKFVAALEAFATELGVEIIDGRMQSVERGPNGDVAALLLEDGRRMEADFFIDASGFRSELVGKELGEPFVPYDASLFNDRTVVGGWERTNEPILPYTTSETMDHGWAWQIEHEHRINRGYVYSSSMTSDDQAREELVRKNPKIQLVDRVVKFKVGRYERAWVKNVLAVGNAGGFVEPLEATALMVMCWTLRVFTDFITQNDPTPGIQKMFNGFVANTWDEIRDFLSIHFKFNTRLDTPYWQRCRAETDVSHIQDLLDFYQENGPTGYNRYNLPNYSGSQFRIEGFLVLLTGCKVPHNAAFQPSAAETQDLNAWRNRHRVLAKNAMTVKEGLAIIRHPNWSWFDEMSPVQAVRHGAVAV